MIFLSSTIKSLILSFALRFVVFHFYFIKQHLENDEMQKKDTSKGERVTSFLQICVEVLVVSNVLAQEHEHH